MPQPAAALERETLQSKILQQLEQRLITGRFRPGEKLALRTLAAQLGTSLMPVRDAIQHLQSIGVLVMRPNRATTVPLLTRPELQELSEVRLMLEGMAAERATVLADRAGMARLRLRFKALQRSRKQGDAADYLQAHWDFHLEIATLGGIPALVGLLTQLWLRIGPTVQISERERGGQLEAFAIHGAIVEAITERDAVKVRQALEADIFHDFPRQDLSRLRQQPAQ